MKHILVPTDFSDNAWNALKYGMQLYKDVACTFFLLHVNPIPPYSGTESPVRMSSKLSEDDMLERSRIGLEDVMAKIEKTDPSGKHGFTTITAHNFFVESIKHEIEKRDIDLVIMGTKGASGLKKVTMGSNTGDVLTKVKCPLLAVPENTVFKTPKEIAFPTDYYLNYDLKVLDTLVDMANLHNSDLRVLHISKKGEGLTHEQTGNKEFLNDYLQGVKHSFHSLTGIDLETSVQCFTQSRDIDMIAMVAKNLNFFQRILFRPKVEQISYHTDIPFLVLHE